MSRQQRDWSRRRLLQLGLAAPWLSACSTGCGTSGGWRRALPEGRQLHVAVIGAGVSGIAAARAMAQAGVRVTVFEARQRVGGRVWTDRSLGRPIDLGASWIHGVRGNPITALAKGQPTRPTDYEATWLYDADGKRVSSAKLERLQGKFEAVVKAGRARVEDQDHDRSLAHAIGLPLRGETLRAQQRRFLAWAIASVEVTTGASARRLSSWWYEEDEAFGGHDVLFPQGYDRVFTPLLTGLSGVSLRLGTRVRRVRWGETGVQLETDQGEIAADGAICTLPLGVLKAGDVRFEPGLPARHKKAIARLGMGVLDKVVLVYERAFWPRKPEFFGFLRGAGAAWPELMNLSAVDGRPWLMAFIGGPFARRVEGLSDAQIASELTASLRRTFGGSVPRPKAIKVTRWVADPLARGAYSHVPVGASLKDHAALAEPVGARLLLAGEHTHAAYPATVHGAWLSGLRAARQALGG